MSLFQSKKKKSGGIAKDRLTLLLLAERVDCSPGVLLMIKNDMIRTMSKYLTVEENRVAITVTHSPAVLTAQFPIREASHEKMFS